MKADHFHFADTKPLPDVQCKRIDYDSFEHLFRITLRDTRDGTSILMTASVPALVSLAHACCSALDLALTMPDSSERCSTLPGVPSHFARCLPT